MFKHLLPKNMCRCKAYSLVHLHWSNMQSFHTYSTLQRGHMWEMYPMCVKMTSSASSTCIQVKEFGFRGHQTDASQWQSLGLVHAIARHTDSFKHYYTGFAPTRQAPCQVYRQKAFRQVYFTKQLEIFTTVIIYSVNDLTNYELSESVTGLLFFMRTWSMLDSFLLKIVAPFGSHV